MASVRSLAACCLLSALVGVLSDTDHFINLADGFECKHAAFEDDKFIPEESKGNEMSKEYVNNASNPTLYQKYVLKSEELLRKLKNYFKMSKQSIKQQIHNHELKKRRMGELKKAKTLEYEESMKRWQENLNITRRKRSANELKKFINKMKNIIPGYLHGKVKPAVDKRKSNHSRTWRRHGRGHNARSRKYPRSSTAKSTSQFTWKRK